MAVRVAYDVYDLENEQRTETQNSGDAEGNDGWCATESQNKINYSAY